MLQRHFYTAGFVVYIELAVVVRSLRLLCTVLLLILPSLGHAIGTNELMGKEHPPLPEGCAERNSSLDLAQRRVLAWVRCGRQDFAILSELGRDEKQKAFKRVLAVQAFPSIPKGFKISAENHCSDSEKKNDDFLWAVVRWKDRKGGMFASEIKYAWRADSKSNRFIQLDPKAVTCSFDWP
jgi:uncharacterized membrane protein